MYYEGPFENNKPNGKGQWHFPYNGNSCTGTHTQKELEPSEEDPEPVEGEPAPKKKYDIKFTAELGIHDSAAGVTLER